MEWRQSSDHIVVTMDAYIDDINPIDVNKKELDDRLLNEKEKHTFASVLAKVRWPVNHIVPELAYAVSRLAQCRKAEITVGKMKDLNKLVLNLTAVKDAGRARMVLNKVDLRKPVVVTHFDASFAQEAGMKSQCGFLTFLAPEEVARQSVKTTMLEFQSSTIARVVKSTMAAESAALSTAIDRHLYVRLLLQAVMNGEPEYGQDWRLHLKVPGIVVTDARSLFDHMSKTGSVPKERQTLIDLLVARDLSENGALSIRWVSTLHQLADMLTKDMKPSHIALKFLQDQNSSLVPSVDEEEEEARRLTLRQGQRKRRKERDEKKKKGGS